VRTVILFGSPHKEGNTRQITDAFADAVRTFEGLGIEYTGHVEAAGCEDKGKLPEATLEAVRKVAPSLL